MNFEASIYRGGLRDRWAVFCQASRTFCFPKRYGRAAAQSLASKLNREAA